MSLIGIPYATRHIDDSGRLILRCPECGTEIVEAHDNVGEQTTNHYAKHYEENHTMSTTAAAPVTVATEVATLVASLGDTKMTLPDLREKVEHVIRQHPAVVTARFTPTGKKGSGLIEALDEGDRLIAKVRVKANGEVDASDVTPDGIIESPVEIDDTGSDPDLVKEAVDAEQPEPVVEAAQPASLNDLLLDLGISSKQIDKALADFPPGIAEAQPNADQRARAADPPKGLRPGPSLATFVVTGENIVQQQERARSKPGGNRPKAEPRSTTPKRAKPDKPAAAAKPASTKKASGSSTRAKYPAEITDAVRLAKIARGTKNGAPGAKQHVMTRTFIANGDSPIDEESVSVDEVTVDRILAASGAKTLKALKAMADGSSSKDELKKLGPLAKAIPDPFCSGRNLASMLVAWIEQIKGAK